MADALVLMECHWPDGAVSLLMVHTPKMSWIKKLGMLTAAQTIENSDFGSRGPDGVDDL